MADLSFSTDLRWQGTGREGQGAVRLRGKEVSYSAPDSIGGKGSGSSHEELLISAVGVCYSGTLFGLLRKKGLPVSRVGIRAEGAVIGYPMQSKFSRLCVSPTVEGGDVAQAKSYEQAAAEARDRCFIGKTITGNVQYDVGEVRVLAAE